MDIRRACCPKCRSDNVTFKSRKTFLSRFGICLIIFFCGYWFYDGMLMEKDVDGVIIVGTLSSIIMMAVSAIVGIIWIIMAIITKKAIYKCMYCKNTFETPVFLPSLSPEDQLHTVRKRKNLMG